VAFRYLDSHANGFREQFSAVHMPGPGVDWYAFSDDVAVELGARAHPDFVGAGSYAYGAWTEANPNELGPHILRNQQYFYGWGASGELSGRLQLGPLVLKGSAFVGKYAAQRDLNRWQERLTVDPPARTRLFHYTASAQIEPPGSPVAVGVNTEVRSWNTHVGAFRRRARVQSHGLQLSIRF
jgi:hypothetical protein